MSEIKKHARKLDFLIGHLEANKKITEPQRKLLEKTLFIIEKLDRDRLVEIIEIFNDDRYLIDPTKITWCEYKRALADAIIESVEGE